MRISANWWWVVLFCSALACSENVDSSRSDGGNTGALSGSGTGVESGSDAGNDGDTSGTGNTTSGSGSGASGSGTGTACTPNCPTNCGQSNGCNGTCPNTDNSCAGVRCGDTNACGTVCSGVTRDSYGASERCSTGNKDCGCGTASQDLALRETWLCTGSGLCRVAGSAIHANFGCLGNRDLNENESNLSRAQYCDGGGGNANLDFANLCRNFGSCGYPGTNTCACD